jgi:hypothetical protein
MTREYLPPCPKLQPFLTPTSAPLLYYFTKNADLQPRLRSFTLPGYLQHARYQETALKERILSLSVLSMLAQAPLSLPLGKESVVARRGLYHSTWSSQSTYGTILLTRQVSRSEKGLEG